MDLKPLFLDIISEPDMMEVKSKFGPRVIQIASVVKKQSSDTLRVVASDGVHNISGVYKSASEIPENLFDAGQLIELSDYTMPVSNGRPFIYFDSFQPRGVAPVQMGEKISALLYKSVRESKGLSLSGKLEANGSGDAAVAAPAQPQPVAQSTPVVATTATISHTESKPKPKGVVGIEAVSPFTDTWKIRARCTQKSDIRHYKKNDRDGKLFNVTFVDETGEIRATAFGDEVDKFYDLLQDNQLYYVSKMRVNPARKNFNTTNNDFELMFSGQTEIEPAEVDASVPGVLFKFTRLDELSARPKDSTVDVLGVMTLIGDSTRFTSKSGQPFDKRSVSIVDQTGQEIEVTLWGNEAQNFEGQQNELLAIKGARVGEFNSQKTLSVQRSSITVLNPVIREAISLRGWYDAEGSNTNFQKVANNDEREKKPLELEFIESVLTAGDNTYHSIKAVVSTVLRKTLYYPACAADSNCKKKAIQQTDGNWRCESCDKEFPAPIYRYIVNVVLTDPVPSRGILVTVFDDIGAELLGVDANHLARLREEDEESAEVKKILRNPVGKEFIFRIQAKLETYQSQENLRFRCMRIMPIYWNKSTNDLLDQIL